ncbi:Predicted hydrolases or acyltransferases (alpha/beta hydrolase superfamily) [Phaffia rhodozyma]|uniref:Predicted hydrolases or acyltransferases (Alpha/beta hydrolase superfamily) n=1 Tax=Phaffia rhodozyma TaxID=264483 RepID=A0A0F7STZ7_PHARH|nr:Predicted hydrolases or acyltransferases (alpha/beta hydrolase superfamily) [Phaffia rhodozyma]
MSKGVPGILHTYIQQPTELPLFESASLGSANCLVFLPGLYDGLVTVPYVDALRRHLEQAGWSLAQPQLTAALKAWGRSSLEQDADEIEQAVDHLRAIGKTNIVLLGHSTGCQQIMEYLVQPKKSNGKLRSTINRAIIQAPVSDREANTDSPSYDPKIQEKLQALYDNTPGDARRDTLCPPEICKYFGLDVTVYRAWSTLCPGGDDDYFSTDLPLTSSTTPSVLRPLDQTFGKLPKDVPLFVIFSGADEYTPNPEKTQPALLDNWTRAAFTNSPDAPSSTAGASKGSIRGIIVPGASHNVKQADKSEWMAQQILDFIKK